MSLLFVGNSQSLVLC